MTDWEDWHQRYGARAAAQGWQICEMPWRGGSALEIRSSISPCDVEGELWAQTHEAVVKFQASYHQGDDAALAAYQLIKRQAGSEFAHWRMWQWQVDNQEMAA